MGVGDVVVGRDVLMPTAVDDQTSANIEHAVAAVQTAVRHMTFAQVAMRGLGGSADDYKYSHQLPGQAY